MNKNEKAVISAKDYGSNEKLNNQLTVVINQPKGEMINLNNSTPTPNKFQLDSAQSRRSLLDSTKLSHLPERRKPFKMTNFVCDVCALPLSLYGENFIETYKDYGVNPLRCLCDLHAEEFELEVDS